jgi:hypothetical protein
MEWEKPSYVEINMSAEIGGYQEEEFPEREPVSAARLEEREGPAQCPLQSGCSHGHLPGKLFGAVWHF